MKYNIAGRTQVSNIKKKLWKNFFFKIIIKKMIV